MYVLSSNNSRAALNWLVCFAFAPELESTKGCIVIESEGVEGFDVGIGRGELYVGSVEDGKESGSKELGLVVDSEEGALVSDGS
jgi:hypothetical protein